MKRARVSEKQIIGVLKEGEAGAKIAKLARRHVLSEAMIYNWESKDGGPEVSEARRLRALESENAKLKRVLVDAILDRAALKDLLASKVLTPAAKQAVASYPQTCHGLSERRACRVIDTDRTSLRYISIRDDDTLLRKKLLELANQHRRLRHRILHILLRGEEIMNNRKNTQRI